MKNKTYLLSTVLIVLMALALLAMTLVNTFLPGAMLPKVNVPNLVLISLVALVIEHYIHPHSKRCYVCIPVFSAAAFALLPFASGYAAANEIVLIAVGGCVTFTVCTYLFTAMVERISSGPACRVAPIISAAGLYFAAQILHGMLI